MKPTFDDRAHAGRRLGEKLAQTPFHDPVVVGIAPGGIPVAREVARALDAPLEAWVAQPLVAPESRHVGAISENGAQEVVHVSTSELAPERVRALADLARPRLAHRARTMHRRPRASMRNHTVVLVDDGIASGATVRAAVRAIRQEKPHRIVVAVPVLACGARPQLDRWVDDLVTLVECEDGMPLHSAYGRFETVPDEVAAELITRTHTEREHAIHRTRAASHPKASPEPGGK